MELVTSETSPSLCLDQQAQVASHGVDSNVEEDQSQSFSDSVDQVQRQYIEEAFTVQTPGPSPTLELVDTASGQCVGPPVEPSTLAVIDTASHALSGELTHNEEDLVEPVDYCHDTQREAAEINAGPNSDSQLQVELSTEATNEWDLDLVQQGGTPGEPLPEASQMQVISSDDAGSQPLAASPNSFIQSGGYFIFQSGSNTVQLASNNTSIDNYIPLFVLTKNDQNNTYQASIVLDGGAPAATATDNDTSSSSSGNQATLPASSSFSTTSSHPNGLHQTPVESQQENTTASQTEPGLSTSDQDLAYKHACDIEGCDRQFNSVGYLKYHLIMHDREKALLCPYQGCGRKFAWPAHLKYHKLTHTNRRAFHCQLPGCDKAFYTSQRLAVHMRTHTGERPFVCPDQGCAKTFTTAGNLKNHLRIHSGERPYTCDTEGCGRSFTEYSSLRKHQVVHSGKKSFQCDICGQLFSQSGSRNVHMRRHQRQQLQRPTLQTIANLQHTSDLHCPTEPSSNSELHSDLHSHSELADGLNNPAILLLRQNGDEHLPYSDHVVTVTTQPKGMESDTDNLGLTETLEGSPSPASMREESLAADPNSGVNVVVLSQPQEIVGMATGCHDNTQADDIVYANKLLRSNMDHEEITSGISVS